VVATWDLSFKRVEKRSPAAAACFASVPSRARRRYPLSLLLEQAGVVLPAESELAAAVGDRASLSQPISVLLARFQAEPPTCYRAPRRLPGPDSHRLATTSL